MPNSELFALNIEPVGLLQNKDPPGFPTNNPPPDVAGAPPKRLPPAAGLVSLPPLVLFPNKPPGFMALLPNKLAPGVPNNDVVLAPLLKLLPNRLPVFVASSSFFG